MSSNKNITSIINEVKEQSNDAPWTKNTKQNSRIIDVFIQEDNDQSCRTECRIIGCNATDSKSASQKKINIFLILQMSSHKKTYNLMMKLNKIISDIMKTDVKKTLVCRICLDSFKERNRNIFHM